MKWWPGGETMRQGTTLVKIIHFTKGCSMLLTGARNERKTAPPGVNSTPILREAKEINDELRSCGL